MKKISLLVMLLLSLCVTAFAENIEDGIPKGEKFIDDI